MRSVTMPLYTAQGIVESVTEEEFIDFQSTHNNQRPTGTVAQSGPVIIIYKHLCRNISLEIPHSRGFDEEGWFKNQVVIQFEIISTYCIVMPEQSEIIISPLAKLERCLEQIRY